PLPPGDPEEPLASATVPVVVAHPRRTLSQADAQACEPADDVVRSPARLLDRLHAGEPLKQRAERRLQLDPPQRRPEAEVDAGAERQVRVRRPADVETVGIGEDLRVAVR